MALTKTDRQVQSRAALKQQMEEAAAAPRKAIEKRTKHREKVKAFAAEFAALLDTDAAVPFEDLIDELLDYIDQGE